MTRRSGRLGHVALAGWLFADLLLVLALVALSDRPDPLAARKPSVSPSQSASHRPAGPRSVDRNWKKFTVAGTDDADLIRQIRAATAPWSTRSAALVQSFGGGTGGTDYAHRVNSLLNRARPAMFPPGTAVDDFLDLGETPSTAIVRVYFYTS